MGMPTAATTITMTEHGLLQLMSLLSPVFPVGGFAYSAGLEAACQSGQVASKEDLESWINQSLDGGTLRNDVILLAETHRFAAPAEDINQLALGLCGSAQRYHETIALGEAFVAAARPWCGAEFESLPKLSSPCAYPVAIGIVTRQLKLGEDQVLLAFLQSSVSNQLQAALRLMSLGQIAAAELQRELEPKLLSCATSTAHRSLDDLGSHAIAMEISAMHHETLTSRIFRS